MVSRHVVLVLTILATLVPDGSIVRRHDRADEAYVRLGARFPAVVRVGDRLGDGTLIDPSWVLTAAHVAEGMQFTGSYYVEIDGQRHDVTEAVLHPDWRPLEAHDIALLRLAAPVEDVAPLAFFEGTEVVGVEAILVGHGMHGDGLRGPQDEDGRKRAATNRIARVDPEFLVFRFDEGAEATELEGTPAGGDSGGPALVMVDGEPRIIGVSSAGEPGRAGPATYGALDYFGRTSVDRRWIDSVMVAGAR